MEGGRGSLEKEERERRRGEEGETARERERKSGERIIPCSHLLSRIFLRLNSFWGLATMQSSVAYLAAQQAVS